MLKKNNVIKLLVLCFVLCMVTAAQAAVYTVTKTADTDDGVCDAADCSLREAIATANSTADEDTIEFDPVLFASAQTINLSSDLHVLEGKLTINGPGAKLLTIGGHIIVYGLRIVEATRAPRFDLEHQKPLPCAESG